MGKLRQSRYSGDEYWTDILWQIKPNNIQPLAGPKFLWDARFTNSLGLVGNAVDTWTDLYQGKILNLFFGEDLSKAPTYHAPGTISYNGVNNYLANDSWAETSSDFTIICVAGNFNSNLASNPGAIIYFYAGTNYSAQYIGEGNIGFSVNDQGIVFINNPMQVIIIQSTNGGTSTNIWVNGGAGTTLGVGGSQAVQFLQIGSIVGSNYLEGDINWLAYYDSAISGFELDNALTYLGNAYNIPVSPVSLP